MQISIGISVGGAQKSAPLGAPVNTSLPVISVQLHLVVDLLQQQERGVIHQAVLHING